MGRNVLDEDWYKEIQRREKGKHCSHNFGWMPVMDTSLFIFEDGTVRFGDATSRAKECRITVICNLCGRPRSAYLPQRELKARIAKNPQRRRPVNE